MRLARGPAAAQVTYKNLDKWFGELQEHSSSVPCVVVANKIDSAPPAAAALFPMAGHTWPRACVAAAPSRRRRRPRGAQSTTR